MNETVSAILSGQVVCAFQNHHLHVVITFANGTLWETTEPAIDDVMNVAHQCGLPCASMTLGTE